MDTASQFFATHSTWWHIFLAFSPILSLIVLLGVLKVAGYKSALITLIIATAIALLAYQFPLLDTGKTLLYGSLIAVFPILMIVVMAIFSYNVLTLTGKMQVIQQQFISISSDRSLQVLLLTWGFGGLLEGMAGFGTAVAIPAVILISLGFHPIFAATVSLIANSVPTAFGAVGIPVNALATQIGIADNPALFQTLSTHIVMQLALLMFIIPFILLTMTDSRLKVLPKNILVSLLVGAVSFAVQYFSALHLGFETPAILGSLASILVIIVFAKLTAAKEKPSIPSQTPYTLTQTLQAWSIYGLTLIFILLNTPYFPIRGFLSHLNTPLTFDIFNAVSAQNTPYTINTYWLVNAGTLLFLGSFIGGMIQGAKPRTLLRLLLQVLKRQSTTIITVCALLTLSSIMNFSGMIAILGATLATVTGSFYPLFAPLIGCLGTFLTGSDTSANILFGKLQADVAVRIGADPSWLAAANTAGATGGKIISPQSIAIAASACEMTGQEGDILKKTLPYALGYVCIVGLIVYFF